MANLSISSDRRRRLSFRQRIGRVRPFGLPLGAFLSVAALVLLIILAIAAPYLAPHNPVKASLPNRMLPPMWLDRGKPEFILGTDGFGRDLFSRLIYGTRISLTIAFFAVLSGGVFGALVGIVSGYKGGIIDVILMRIVDVFMALPTILIAIALAVALGPSFQNLIIVISLLLWPNIARQIRGTAIVVCQQEYMQYATSIGVPTWRLLLFHVLPNVTPTLCVVLTLEVGSVILTEASLGFLGAGVPPPTASWGAIVADGRALIMTGWWIALFPGIAIMATVLTFNTLGDWLRERFDPRLKLR
jgi:peptide/nickel transport system permease protein